MLPRIWIAASLLAVAGLLALGPSCRRDDRARAPGSMRVVVTIAPLAGLVKPLLPEGAEVTTLIAPGRSEHGYEITAADASALARADLVVMVGPGLEGSVAAHLAKHPARHTLVLLDALGIRGATGDHDEHGAEHQGEHAGASGAPDHEDEHNHGGVDPHAWLDPVLVAQVVPAVRKAVEGAEPAPAPGEPARLDGAESKLLKEVGAVDAEYRQQLAPFKGAAIVTHHAAWKRLADRYGLVVAAVIRPIEGSEPTAEAVTAAVHAIQEQHVPAVFVEPQFSPQAAERIASIAGVKVATLDPLGNGDWAAMMRANLKALFENLRPPGK